MGRYQASTELDNDTFIWIRCVGAGEQLEPPLVWNLRRLKATRQDHVPNRTDSRTPTSCYNPPSLNYLFPMMLHRYGNHVFIMVTIHRTNNGLYGLENVPLGFICSDHGPSTAFRPHADGEPLLRRPRHDRDFCVAATWRPPCHRGTTVEPRGSARGPRQGSSPGLQCSSTDGRELCHTQPAEAGWVFKRSCQRIFRSLCVFSIMHLSVVQPFLSAKIVSNRRDLLIILGAKTFQCRENTQNHLQESHGQSKMTLQYCFTSSKERCV